MEKERTFTIQRKICKMSNKQNTNGRKKSKINKHNL